MKLLLTTELDSNQTFNVACNAGERVRVLSIVTAVASLSIGDEARFTFTYQDKAVVVVATQPMTDQIIEIAASIGGPQTGPLVTDEVLATGVFNFAQAPQRCCTPLPDITFSQNLSVIMAMTGGGITSGVLLYEKDTGT